eukprot:7381048-Prymnesium_polylepis.2
MAFTRAEQTSGKPFTPHHRNVPRPPADLKHAPQQRRIFGRCPSQACVYAGVQHHPGTKEEGKEHLPHPDTDTAVASAGVVDRVQIEVEKAAAFEDAVHWSFPGDVKGRVEAEVLHVRRRSIERLPLSCQRPPGDGKPSEDEEVSDERVAPGLHCALLAGSQLLRKSIGAMRADRAPMLVAAAARVANLR